MRGKYRHGQAGLGGECEGGEREREIAKERRRRREGRRRKEGRKEGEGRKGKNERKDVGKEVKEGKQKAKYPPMEEKNGAVKGLLEVK